MLKMLLVILYGVFYGILIATPIGPANIELIRRCIHYGIEEALKVGLGIALSDALLCFLVYLGVIKILLSSKLLNILLGLFCSGLMFFFGINGLKDIFFSNENNTLKYIQKPISKKRSSFITGFSINITNPMVIGFWVVFLGAITSYGIMKECFLNHQFLSITLFSFGVLVGSIIWFYFFSKIIQLSKKHMTPLILEIINFICSSIFILFGIGLLIGVIKII